jgi:hypothetical protein
MSEQGDITKATRNILTHSLDLNRDQNLLIFADAGSVGVAEAVAKAARQMDIYVSVLYVFEFIQEGFDSLERLPHPIEAAMQEADAILSCLSDRPEHMAYRARVLTDGWRRHAKLAHVPGITLDILRMADTDYDLIRERCNLLAMALVLGREVEIISHDRSGETHRLIAQLGGWEFPPGISDGVIAKGSWANLPPGETYTIPVGAEGSIAINGSIPGKVIGPGESLQIYFEKGRVVTIEPQEDEIVQYLHRTQITHAQRRGDANWRNLAEIGFGMNPTIQELVGIELIDEKKAGTLHVGLGSSTLLGGRVDSTIHCDLVVEGATVYIDGRPILEQGSWRLDPTTWQLDHRTVVLPQNWWEGCGAIRRSGSRYGLEEGRLVRYWSSRSGQQNGLLVGCEETARSAGRLMRLLNDQVDSLVPAEVIERARDAAIPADQVPALLWALHCYDLVRIERNRAP